MTDRQAPNVVPFKRRQRRRSKSDAPARVFAFPPARHRKIVAYVAAEMRKGSSIDAAEEALVYHLNVEWGRLERLGVSEAEAEMHCLDFARAAWRAALATCHNGEEVA